MPGSGTHTTVIQHLAQANATFPSLPGNPTLQSFLGDPSLNASWDTYATVDALKSRYAVLGAMGPDIFYAMLDYGGDTQTFEDVLIKILGTIQCASELSANVNQLIDGTLDKLTFDVWNSIQSTFGYVSAILKDGALNVVIDQHNFWSFFLPLRQVDDYRPNWYWADYLHYVKSGAFTQKLLDMCQTYSTDPITTGYLKAYSLGYLTHYVSDTVGHAYVNRIVESPWRNCWQRHHLVENFIDAYLWDHWHDPSSIRQKPADEQGLDVTIDSSTAAASSRRIGDGAPLHYARLNDLCNIGHEGIQATIDAAIASVCNAVKMGEFTLGVSSVPTFGPADDPAFITWTNFMADAMWETYPPTQDHPIKLASSASLGCRVTQGGYPTPDDIAGAYGAYRLILSLATEDDMEPPTFPDIVGDISTILNQLWNQINQNLGNIPPPPPLPSTGGFSLDGLWDAIKSYGQWLDQVAAAVLQTVVDVVAAAAEITGDVVTEPLKVALWLLNSALYALYHNLRMGLVLSAYSVPLSEDLVGVTGDLDLRTLWTTMAAERQPYPIEPLLSQRDLASDPSNPHSPYRPYFKPSEVTPPPNVETPSTSPPEELLAWMTPDDMLEKPIGKDVLLSASGPAPPTTQPLVNPNGTLNTFLQTFDGSQRYFGGVFANCEAALNVAVPYISGVPMPEGTVLPDYNLDSDRGYAWPCWDVDYFMPAPNGTTPIPWSGCDPFPDDTIRRATKLPPVQDNILALLSAQAPIDWGRPDPPRPGLRSIDPFNKARNGLAWVNAAALSPGNSGDVPFSWIQIDTTTPTDGDSCGQTINAASPGNHLTFDYQLAPSSFLNPGSLDCVDLDPTSPGTMLENDGRLIDFLRDQATLKDPLWILANAVTIAIDGTVMVQGPKVIKPPGSLVADPVAVEQLVTAVAQLAVTGRESFSAFGEPQDVDLERRVVAIDPGTKYDPPLLASTVRKVLDIAYLTLWAVRGNEAGWRDFRSNIDSNLDLYFGSNTPTHLKWIAASGFDDTPHRPINVPTAPYPQYDLTFSVPSINGTPPMPQVTTRYLVASAHTFIGPIDPKQSSLTEPAVAATLLQAPPPPVPFSSSPAPRTAPQDKPSIPPDDEIIIYIHGGGSRAEEAVGLANWLIYEGSLAGRNYTVISFDLPNSAYASRFDITDVLGGTVYHPSLHHIRDFEMQYILSFVDELDRQMGNVKSRVAAVMGGSLGGNMSLLLSCKNNQELHESYLDTIVAWSVTAVSPSTYLGILSNGLAGAYLAHLKERATNSELVGTPREDHTMETQYLSEVYFAPLSPGHSVGSVVVVPYIPPDPLMWFRGPDPVTGVFDLPCKMDYIAQSRFDRYEIYSVQARHWTNAIDLEQIYFSFQDDCLYQSIASSDTSHLLLAAGDCDNYHPPAIYNSTIDVARLIRHTAHGKAEFWLDTGHSLHSERPHLFAKEIVYFLTHLDARGSPNGTVGAPQPVPYASTDE